MYKTISLQFRMVAQPVYAVKSALCHLCVVQAVISCVSMSKFKDDVAGSEDASEALLGRVLSKQLHSEV